MMTSIDWVRFFDGMIMILRIMRILMEYEEEKKKCENVCGILDHQRHNSPSEYSSQHTASPVDHVNSVTGQI